MPFSVPHLPLNAFAIVSGRTYTSIVSLPPLSQYLLQRKCPLVLVVSFPKTRGLCRRLLLLFTGTSENVFSSSILLSPVVWFSVHRRVRVHPTVVFLLLQSLFSILSCRNNANSHLVISKFIASTSNKSSYYFFFYPLFVVSSSSSIVASRRRRPLFVDIVFFLFFF